MLILSSALSGLSHYRQRKRITPKFLKWNWSHATLVIPARGPCPNPSSCHIRPRRPQPCEQAKELLGRALPVLPTEKVFVDLKDL